MRTSRTEPLQQEPGTDLDDADIRDGGGVDVSIQVELGGDVPFLPVAWESNRCPRQALERVTPLLVGVPRRHGVSPNYNRHR